MGFRQHTPPHGGGLAPSPPEPHYLAFQKRLPMIIYRMQGRPLLVRCQSCPLSSICHDLVTRVWVPAGTWQHVAAMLSYCFPQYLNVSNQNLKLFRPRTRERKKELISQPLLHSIYSLGLYPDQATWAAQRARRAPTPVAASTLIT